MSQEALKHRWLTGVTAGNHDIVKDLRSRRVRARLRLGIERVQLARRIENLKGQVGLDDAEDVPMNANQAAEEAYSAKKPNAAASSAREKLSRAAKSDIFREIVLAAAREERRTQELNHAEKRATTTSTTTTTGNKIVTTTAPSVRH